MSQLSIESNKSDQFYEMPIQETNNTSPIHNTVEKTRIYNLLWPRPKTVIELDYISPFVVGKELFISILQVKCLFLKKCLT